MADEVTARRDGECETINGTDRDGHTASDHNEVQHVAPGSRPDTLEDSVDAKPITAPSSHPPALDNNCTSPETPPAPERALSVPADHTTPPTTVRAGGDSYDARAVIQLNFKYVNHLYFELFHGKNCNSSQLELCANFLGRFVENYPGQN